MGSIPAITPLALIRLCQVRTILAGLHSGKKEGATVRQLAGPRIEDRMGGYGQWKGAQNGLLAWRWNRSYM